MLLAARLASDAEAIELSAGDWPTEGVRLASGRTHQGLIESEDDVWLHLIEVFRRPGRPMSLLVRPIERESIESITRLEPAQRRELRERILQFVHRAEIERARMAAVPLHELPTSGAPRYRYDGRWFSAECTTDEQTTRRLIVRIEQVFAACRCMLPVRVEPRCPPRLVVFGSLDEYQGYLAARGLNIANRAVYFPEENRIVAGSELARYAAERANMSAEHEALEQELEQLERGLPKRLQEIGDRLKIQGASRKNISRILVREKREAEELIEQKEREISRIERQNDLAFEEVARETLTRLYHETFHAYLQSYVYPHQSHSVPHWLNEGLATVFEECRVESGTMRLDSLHEDALVRLQEDLGRPDSLPLSEVLQSDFRGFHVVWNHPSREADLLYAYAWGMAHYLTFEQRALGSSALDRYVAREAEATPPVVRFERLVGMPLQEFEKRWREYVKGLK